MSSKPLSEPQDTPQPAQGLTPLEHRRQVAKLREETEALELEASRLQSRLSLLEQRYALMVTSASWRRAVDLRGRVKKWTNLRAFPRRLARLVSRYWRRGVRQLEIQSVCDATMDNGTFRPKGSHPGALLTCPDGQSLPTGWILLELELSRCDGASTAVIVSDDSLGFSMHGMFAIGRLTPGRSQHLVRLPATTKRLRLDIKGDHPLRFTAIKATHLGQIQLLYQLLQYQPSGLPGFIGLLVKKGVHQAKIDLLAPIRSGLAAGYRIWAARFDSLDQEDLAAIGRQIEDFAYRPLISIVMPTYNSHPDYLAAALDSVLAQAYSNWELCIADDCSPEPAGKAVLRRYAEKDRRIKLTFRTENGNISAATNSAIDLAEGEFTALMDHDDLLPAHALYRLVLELQDHPEADILYSSEDKIDEAGERWGPYFKQDWNYDLFLGQNLVSHLGVYRTALLKKIGGFQLGYEGSQDYDLAIRALEATRHDKVRRIPDVLYHWRVFSTSGSFSTTQQGRALATARQALVDHERRCHSREVEVREAENTPIFHLVSHPLPSPLPKISLIASQPFASPSQQQALARLQRDSDHPALELLWARRPGQTPPADPTDDAPHKALSLTETASPSVALNSLAAAATGDYLCFLSPAAELVERNWLTSLLAQAHRPGIGAVGSRLLDHRDRVYFSGYCLDEDALLTAPFRGAERGDAGYNGWLCLPRNVSSLSLDCLLIRKDLFIECGGFDASAFPDGLADADLCLRLWQAGLRVLWTPESSLKLTDRDSHPLRPALCDVDLSVESRKLFSQRWRKEIADNRFFNPFLTLHGEGLDYACPPRIARPWQAYKS